MSLAPRDLLKLASSKLGPIVGQGSPYSDPKADDKEILDLLNFFQESSAQVYYLTRIFLYDFFVKIDQFSICSHSLVFYSLSVM